MGELALVVVGAVLGALLTLVVGRIEAWRKERDQRRRALERLNNLLSSVRGSVAHGHDFANKLDWYRELEQLAQDDRLWLDELFEPTKRIAWRIRDHSFDHNGADAAEYCCDELLVDLILFQLSLLPSVPMDRRLREARSRQLAREFLMCTWGALPAAGGDSRDPVDKLVEKFLEQWRRRDLKLPPKYVMSSRFADLL